MAAVAVGHDLEHRRLARLAGAAQQPVGGLDDRLEVVAVDPLAVHTERGGSAVDVRLGGGAIDARAHAVAVVDDEEDDREVPEGGEVERLVPGAHVHRAVAELADHGLLLAAADHGEREAGGDRQLAGHDAPAAVEAAVDVEQVHRAAAAVRAAVGAAEQLRHHGLRRYSAGEREAVAAITGDELVGLLHRVHDADGGRLLPGGEVAVAADLGGLVLALGLGLEHPDEHHLLVEPAQVGRREGRRGVHRRHAISSASK